MKKTIKRIVKELLVPSSSVYMFSLGKEIQKLLKDTKFYNQKYEILYEISHSNFINGNILNIVIKGNIYELRNYLMTYMNQFTLYDISGDTIEWAIMHEDKIVLHAVM